MTQLEAKIKAANPVPESGPGSEVTVPPLDVIWAAAATSGRPLRGLRRPSTVLLPGPDVRRLGAVATNLGRNPRAVWSALGAAATALAGGIVAAVVLLSSGAGVAYAGWTATPTQPTAAAVASSSRMCNRLGIGTSRFDRELRGTRRSDVFTGTPVLTEARGIYTAVVSDTDRRLYLCLAGARPSKPPRGTVVWFASAPAEPGRNQISFPYGSAAGAGNVGGPDPLKKLAGLTLAQRIAAIMRLTGGGYGRYVLGRVGRDVTGVSFAFANGNSVTATVENGRYFAWWPWISPATSVTLTTSMRTITSRLYKRGVALLGNFFLPLCKPGARGCAFAPNVRTSSS